MTADPGLASSLRQQIEIDTVVAELKFAIGQIDEPWKYDDAPSVLIPKSVLQSWCARLSAGLRETRNEPDVVCEHGVAMDVHCCGCHPGFLFDSRKCICF